MFKTFASTTLSLALSQPVFQYEQDQPSNLLLLSRTSFASNSDASFINYEFPTRQEHWHDHFGGRLALETWCSEGHAVLPDDPEWCFQPGGMEASGPLLFILSSESASPGRIGQSEFQHGF